MAAESTEQRKARLEALRVAVELSAAPPDAESEEAVGEAGAAAADGEEADATEAENREEPKISFRNYVPRDEKLQELKIAPPQPLKFDDPVRRVPAATNSTEDPIVSIAPRKANWDLRRDVAKKLEKLERRTQRVIIELMQEEEKRRQAANAEAEVEVEMN